MPLGAHEKEINDNDDLLPLLNKVACKKKYCMNPEPFLLCDCTVSLSIFLHCVFMFNFCKKKANV